MIGRHHQQLRVCAEMLLHMQRSHGDGGGGVAAKRLQQQVEAQALGVHRAVVVQGAKQQVAVGHGQDAVDARQVTGPQEGLLQQALVVAHAHEGLGHVLPRNRP